MFSKSEKAAVSKETSQTGCEEDLEVEPVRAFVFEEVTTGGEIQ
jgi:hypothetical protein